jgi:hypothetical protein
MSSTTLQPSDEAWEAHKATIRHLYLVDKIPLKVLVIQMNNKGLMATYDRLGK